MAAGGNASFPVTTGSAPGPAALPLADAALDIFPSLNDTDLAHEIASGLGLGRKLTAAAHGSSRGGTAGALQRPGWLQRLPELAIVAPKPMANPAWPTMTPPPFICAQAGPLAC